MNVNESFSDRLNFYKQQNKSTRLADITTREQNQREENEKSRLEEITKRKNIIETVAKTKETFKGTRIVETFQEIVDKKILIFANINEIVFKRTLLVKNKRFDTLKKIPAKIGFNLNEIYLMYNAEYILGGEYDPSYYTYERICVTKNKESKFNLTLPSYEENELIKDKTMSSDEVINRIANFIASHKSHAHTFNHNITYPDCGSSIMKFSESCDRESGIF
jgi:hypothetical protein